MAVQDTYRTRCKKAAGVAFTKGARYVRVQKHALLYQNAGKDKYKTK